MKNRATNRYKQALACVLTVAMLLSALPGIALGAEAVPENAQNLAQEDVPGNPPENVPDEEPENTPENVPDGEPENTPENVPDETPENTPDAQAEDVQSTPKVWDFSDATDFVGTETAGRKEGTVTMKAEVMNGLLAVSGTHSGDQAAQIYTTLYEGLSIPVTKETRLSYRIEPQQPVDKQYDYDFYSMHMAVDLKFEDGTYLSKSTVEDQNRVLADPNSQGEAKAVVYEQDNLIIINLGELNNDKNTASSLVGKKIVAVLVGYANTDGLKETGGDYKTEIDTIRIEDVSPVYETKADYVSVLRGTNNLSGRSFSRGLTGPMVAVPHGFNFWAPETGSGDEVFEYKKGVIDAIRNSHEPSVWVGERGRWTFMVDSGKTGSSGYDAETLVSKAHYFSADFTSGMGEGTKLELSPTDHGVAVRFTYNQDVEQRGIVFDKLKDFEAEKGGKTFTATSPKGSNGLPQAYIYGTFDQAIESVSADGVTFAAAGSGKTVVVMTLATSFISIDQAQANLDLEMGGKSFDQVTEAAKTLWNEKLNIIDIEGATEDQMITFYSNMYRLFLYPNNMGEKTGDGNADGWQYRSPYTKVVTDGKLYYNNGFWDTYRTTWAAYSLLTPEQNTEMLDGLLRHFDDSDWIPRWVAPTGTNSMVGTSSDVIFGDALLRGATLSDEQWAMAYQAALKNGAMSVGATAAGGRDSLNTSIFLGYTPGTEHEKMSWAMEGYINDFGIANMARALGDNDAYEYYISRATNYVNLFWKEEAGTDGWFRGKDADGNWPAKAFDPTSWGGPYTETNAWNMAFSVPQDGQGLVNLYGSQKALADKLDEFFTTPGEFDVGGYGYTIHEMLEAREVKMGQYGHSNQPSHHIPYMYLYAGRPDKTQEKVRDVLRQCYVGSRVGQGYIGDEDNGEMSAWYIFSALGFYPLNMGSGELVFGSPLFTKATIHYESGKDLVIEAPNNSRENIYVNSLTINGEAYDKTSIAQTELTNRLKNENVTLSFDMQSTPSDWGKDAPPASITEGSAVADPLVDQTTAGTTILTTMPDFATAPSAVSAYSAQGAVKNLFDNNSATSVTLTPVDGKSTVYYSFPKATSVSLYTLTSGKDKTKVPTRFTLLGSVDGKTWTTLDERLSVAFDWSTYTKPFATQTPDFLEFQYFRLDIYSDGPAELAELELMSRSAPTLNKAFLNGLLVQAEEVKKSLTANPLTLMTNAITAAKAVADNASATAIQFKEACTTLAVAVSNLSGVTELTETLAEAKEVAITLPTAMKALLTEATAQADTALASGTVAVLQGALYAIRIAMDGVKVSQNLDAKITVADTAYAALTQEPLKKLLKETMDQIKAVRNDVESTPAEFRTATTTLEKSLVDVQGVVKLWSLLEEAKKLDTSSKPQLLAENLKTAIKGAEDTITASDTSIAKLQTALTELEIAWKNINLEDLRKGYEKIEAESYDDDNGIANDGGNIGGSNPGKWVRYDGVYFDGKGAEKMEMYYSAALDAGGEVHVILDDLSNTPICILKSEKTGDWSKYTKTSGSLTQNVTGVHSVYLSFVGTNAYVANIDWIQFQEPSSSSGGGGGGGGGGGSSGTGNGTVTNPDGSTTTTVTDSKTGEVTTTRKYDNGVTVKTVAPKTGETISQVTLPSTVKKTDVVIPGTNVKAGTVAVIIKADGTQEIVKWSSATKDGMRVTLEESAQLKLIDNSKSFSDMQTDHWANDSVQFVTSRELFQGTDQSSFTPSGSMTRGMLVTVLARLDGQNTAGGETWYSNGLSWGKESGIMDGTNPEGNITRESLAVMLYRYAGQPGATGESKTFPDSGRVSVWATQAMNWAVQNGILTGNGAGELVPGGAASRAEVAAMLQRFISL